MKTKIKIVFCAREKNMASWPHVGFDEAARAEEWMKIFRAGLPEDIELAHSIYKTPEEARKGYEETERGIYDGWAVITTRQWTDVEKFYAENVSPVVVADDIYCGTGGFLKTLGFIEQEKLPVATVTSSNPEDTVQTVRLLAVMAAMKKSRILVISDNETPHGTRESYDAVKQIFGTDVVLRSSADLQDRYDFINEKDAASVAERWGKEAKLVIEPDAAELIRSARMYLAIKKFMEEEKANAVSVDCLCLFYANNAAAYPCMSFFQLNNDGSTGVCEGDLHSTVCQLLFRYLCGKPAYISDPVLDEAAGQIVYAHCVATNRPHGSGSQSCPYIIRTHAEDRKGASTQTLLPLGETVTTIALSPQHKTIGLHTARTVANVDDERACRTKLAAEVDVDKMKANYHFELFGWHQTTCYGDYRRSMKQLARLYGLRCIEQDR